MKKITVNRELCDGCLDCQRACESLHESSRIAILEYESAFYPIVCQQCEGEPCSQICPVDAMSNEGVDSERCISCGLCSMVCPFGAITITPNTAEKCNQCVDREEGPACVQACSKRAISLVDIDKSKSNKQQEFIAKLAGNGENKSKKGSFVNVITAMGRSKQVLDE
ncbi:MAG: 4Fe-4S dicluster domain-containing protein [Methanobrevibacter sp.]|nr:4Fe-4S dicluster domain-containing protein [Methanobrevibacter sp.]